MLEEKDVEKQIIEEKFSHRGVLRRIKDFAFYLNSFCITPKGIQDAILRVGEACKSAYFENLQKARDASYKPLILKAPQRVALSSSCPQQSS
jgi:hypothetical protein